MAMAPSKLRDLVGNAPLKDASMAAMSIIDAVQNCKDNGVKVLGLTAAWLLIVESSGISVSDLLAYSRNCINTAEGRRPEFKAVESYINNEILKQK